MSIVLILWLSWLALVGQPERSVSPSDNFKIGESLEFRLNYGWFTVGKAQVNIDPRVHDYNDRSCLKVEITGQTAGFVGIFTDVNDKWGAYVETGSLRPQHAYRDIQEGKYERIERTYFDFDSKKVRVDRYNPLKDVRRPTITYDLQENVKDLMSSYLLLRNTDFTHRKKGDSLFIDTFYEDELYHFLLLYDGLETVTTPVGKQSAHKLYLIMEENEVFPEKGGIIAWISNDRNQLPLRIQAEMFFGNAYCDLVSYKNLKYAPDFE